MKSHWGAILAFCGHAVASAQQAPMATITTRINTGTCGPNGASGGFGSGTVTGIGIATGTGSSGGSTGVAIGVGVVTSNSGEVFELRGCYSTPISGNVLDGQSIVTTEMTLSYCATFCQGSSNYFAIQNGNECMCGVVTPATVIVDIGECSTGCAGNAAESCGAFRYAIIYSSSSTPAGSTSDIVFTTTNSQGSTIITTSTSVAPVTVPSYSSSVSVYTTTDSHGSPVVTSSTTVVPVPVPSYSSSVSVYTTTDSHGSSVVTSSTTVVPVPVPSYSSSVSVYTTTDSHGSSVVTSSSTVVTISSPTTSPTVTVVTTTNDQRSVITTSTTLTPDASPSLCPGGTGTTYSDADGNVYEISCGESYLGSDLPAIHTDTFSACILACSNYVPTKNSGGGAACIAASWGEGNPGGNCYLKYAITEINVNDGGIDSCRLVSYNPPTPPSTTSGGRGATSTSSTMGSSGGSGITSASTTGTSTATATTSTSSINSSAAASPCPSADGTTYSSSSSNAYEIYCSAEFPGKDLPAVHEDTFEACLVACDIYVPSSSVAGGASCVAASWGEGNVGGNCYLKYAITEIVFNDGGFCSGRRTTYNPPSVSSSTEGGSSATTTSSASSSNSAASTTSSSSSTTTTSSSISSPTTSSSIRSTTTTSTSSSSGTTSSSTSTTTSTSSSSSSSSMTSSSTSSSIPTTLPSTTTSATVTSISSAASPTNPGYQPTYTPVCPGANNTQYVDFAGSLYNVKCGLQITGKNLKAVHADTFTACIEYCDLVTGCAGTTYLNGAAATNANCYPYYQFTSYGAASPSGIYSAVLANGGTTNETIDSQSLCPALNGSEFTDPAGYTYSVGCDLQINGANLAAAVTPDLSGCLQFCDTYATCVGVDFGPGATAGYNCYPKSSYTNTTYLSGNQYAQLVSTP